MNGSSNGGNATGSSWRAADYPDDAAAVERAEQVAGEAIDELKRRTADYVEQGKQTAAEMAAAIEQQIRQRPVEAVAVAAGFGFALGLLWSRRSYVVGWALPNIDFWWAIPTPRPHKPSRRILSR